MPSYLRVHGVGTEGQWPLVNSNDRVVDYELMSELTFGEFVPPARAEEPMCRPVRDLREVYEAEVR